MGASQVSGRRRGRPAHLLPGGMGARVALFPEGFQAPPHGILLSLFSGCGGRPFWGESVCPMLPWRQLFLEARGGVARGRHLGWSRRWGHLRVRQRAAIFCPAMAGAEPWARLCPYCASCLAIHGFSHDFLKDTEPLSAPSAGVQHPWRGSWIFVATPARGAGLPKPSSGSLETHRGLGKWQEGAFCDM